MNEQRGGAAQRRRRPPAPRPGPPLVFRHDPQLPISARREEICAALGEHQVLIVAGETGSGKSTQLPQYCLELGRGAERRIAHTQPRRLAARALASRIAEEVGQPVGQSIGYRVRFADQISAATRLVLVTDGLLLAELSEDPRLERYDTVIVDEAHERTLNIDLLLGVLKRLLPQRPDLKVIITSATLEVERMAAFFAGAPVIAVSGRSHPIEVQHLEDWWPDATAAGAASDAASGTPSAPSGAELIAASPAAQGAPAAASDEAGELDLSAAVLEALRVIETTPGAIGAGDVLVFLPGEREIRDVAELLEREFGEQREVLVLYSRLSWEQQRRIFERGTRPRVVLATNVAETSITVPGIRAVIDSGLARISRYSPRSRLQRLPIEPISRASAEQRKGRCGRIGAGLCLRLYTRVDFEARAAFTEPEILRTNLAALLLRLAADGLGEAERFPFLDAPDARALKDGYRLLQELEALDAERRVTRRGRQMARLPLDPRLARALLESRRFQAEGELLVLVAGLSVPDPRLAGEEPAVEAAGVAAPVPTAPAPMTPSAAGAAPLEDGRSEFLSLVQLFRAYRAKRAASSRRELRRWCREQRLSLLRLSEWEDVYAQVTDRAAELGLHDRRRPSSYAGLHRSLLAGFVTLVGLRGEEGVYLGVRGLRFHLFPGSPLRRRRPRWVLAAHIVETSRVFGRRLAEIEPHWIESAAPHLIQREYLEPDWDEERAEVRARERVTLLGLTLAAHRRVNYGPIAPEEARGIFAREALVHGRLRARPDWLEANDAALAQARRLEERLRMPGLLQPAEALVEHYIANLPRQVSSGAALEHFSRHLTEAQRAALRLTPALIFAHVPDPTLLAQFPEVVRLEGLAVPIDYRFAPGEAEDGATLELPLLALPRLTRAAVEQAIPGLLAPRIEALLRSLPKEARRRIIPVSDTARRFLDAGEGPADAEQHLAAWLTQTFGIDAALVRFDRTQVPAHLVPRLRVRALGAATDASSELKLLRRQGAHAARAELDARAAAEYPGVWRRFELDELPDTQSLALEGGHLEVHPSLRAIAGGVCVRFEWSAAEATRAYEEGAIHLARQLLEPLVRALAARLAREVPLLLAAAPFIGARELTEVLVQRSIRASCFEAQGAAAWPRTRAGFETALEAGRAQLHERATELITIAAEWFAQARAVRRLLEDPRARTHAAAAEETHAHLGRLLAPRRLGATSSESLRQLTRHLKAEERRWQRLLSRGSEPAPILGELDRWTLRLAELEGEVASELRWLPQIEELRLWIEEYRVSLYAQELRTLGPVSAPRLEQRAAAVERWLNR